MGNETRGGNSSFVRDQLKAFNRFNSKIFMLLKSSATVEFEVTGEAPQAGPKTIALFNSQIWSLTIQRRQLLLSLGAFACALGAINKYRLRVLF